MNYLFLPGTSSNYASAPDAVGVDITGDIDVRNFFAPYSFRPAAEMDLLTKWEATGNKKCWATALATSGVLRFYFTTDGTTTLTRSSTVAITANPGTPIWTRATLKADNGAAGHDVTFYTSSDGVTWVQLGAVVTTAGTVTMANASSSLRIGTESTNTTSLYSGKYFYGEIRSGIGGSVVANPDFRGYVSSGSTDSVGNVWTVNKSGNPPAYSAQIINRAPANHLFLPGTAGNRASTPDSVSLSITTDIDIRAYIQTDNYNSFPSPSGNNAVVAKDDASTQREWEFRFGATTNFLGFLWWDSGGVLHSHTSSAAFIANNGTAVWLRVTFATTTGTSTFYDSSDGVTWRQIGTPQVFGATSIRDMAAPVTIGATGSDRYWNGKVYYAEIRNGINGTVVASPDFRGQGLASGFSDSSGNVWTINTSGTPAAALVSRTAV